MLPHFRQVGVMACVGECLPSDKLPAFMEWHTPSWLKWDGQSGLSKGQRSRLFIPTYDDAKKTSTEADEPWWTLLEMLLQWAEWKSFKFCLAVSEWTWRYLLWKWSPSNPHPLQNIEVEHVVRKDRRITIREILDQTDPTTFDTHSISRYGLPHFGRKSTRCSICRWSGTSLSSMGRMVMTALCIRLWQRVRLGFSSIHPKQKSKAASGFQWEAFPTPPERAKIVPSAKKSMLVVSFDHNGTIYRHFVPEGRTINSKVYQEILSNISATSLRNFPQRMRYFFCATIMPFRAVANWPRSSWRKRASHPLHMPFTRPWPCRFLVISSSDEVAGRSEILNTARDQDWSPR